MSISVHVCESQAPWGVGVKFQKYCLLGIAWNIQICAEKSCLPTSTPVRWGIKLQNMGGFVGIAWNVQIFIFYAIPNNFFCNLTTTLPYGAERLEKMSFLCRFGHFIQFLATDFFATWSATHPMVQMVGKYYLSVQIWTFHWISSKTFFVT